ncbi:MAG: hypothetical protein KAH46_13750, partial [Mycobacterium sp.]|nr:hypothetical protein [Mycobacterium sp.]
MITKRLTWAGTSIVAILGILLGWRQVSDVLPPWSVYAVTGLVVLASMLTYPFGIDDDGTTRRLINVRTRGRGHQIAVSGGAGPANTGTMANTQKGDITLNSGLQVSYSELKQMTVDASRPVVLPEAREVARRVASDIAIRTIDDRSSLLVQKVIDELNKNPELFARWNDPRFLAALTSAQRSFAETGDEDLADTLARMVAGLAAREIRTRREIVLRQAIDVAPRLTTGHINALAVLVYLTRFKINEPYFGPSWMAKAINALCKPYFEQMPASALDYEYMSSTGVCYANQLHQFGGGPYQILHDKYLNAMYESLKYEDVKELIGDDNPQHAEHGALL